MEATVIAFDPNRSISGTASHAARMNNGAVQTAPATCRKLDEIQLLEAIASQTVTTRIRVKRGEALYRAGDTFRALYIVQSGFLKTFSLCEDGREQITGFHMGSEVIGMDGIESDEHRLTAIALEDASVASIPYTALQAMCIRDPKLQTQLIKLMGKAIVRAQEVGMLIGSMRAEERIASFLIDLSHRLAERGYSPAEFHLRMTREEIGSYLGLKLETVSRTFSRFQDMGFFEVHNKHICGLNTARMSASLQNAEVHRAAA